MGGPDADPDPDFESWLRASYHNRPAPSIARELFEQEQARRAAERRKAWERGEIAALSRRVRQLERIYLDGTGGIGGPLVTVLAESMAEVKSEAAGGVNGLRSELLALIAEEREKTTERISKMIDTAFANRMTMFYRGIHSDQNEYARGDVVTAAGSLWMATDTVEKGRKPGGPPWRLIVKAGQPAATTPPPVVA